MPTALSIVRKYFPDVEEVHDADESILLEVTSKDSKEARRKDPNNCAMAAACKRAFKARGVIITIGHAYIVMNGGAVRYQLPESVSREIISFDRAAGFAEGQYKLTKPKKSHRLGARQARKQSKGSSSHPTEAERVRSFKHYTEGIRVIGNKAA